MRETTVDSDNGLANWFSSAARGDVAIYYSYEIKNRAHPLLCSARIPRSPNDAPARELDALAMKAWSLKEAKVVALAQRRDDVTCQYVCIKR